MTSTRLAAALMASAAMLAGCGGGGGGGPSIEDLARELDAVADRTSGVQETPLAAMPTSGTARYTGSAALVSDVRARDLLEDPDTEIAAADEIALGRLRMEADFGASTIEGRVTDLKGRFEDRDVDVEGQIDLTNGTIRRNEFEVDADGALTADGDTIDVTGEVEGVFGGVDASVIAGAGDLDVTGTSGIDDMAIILLAD